jgi:CBS domain-containing protein
MRAKDILDQKGSNVVSIAVDASLQEAIAILAEKNIGAVIVRDGEAIAGILSERDIVRVLAGAPTGFRETPVRDVMTTDVHTCGPGATIDDLLDVMTERRIRHIPVVEAGRLCGVLSIGDVVKHRIREAEGEAAALKDYIVAG